MHTLALQNKLSLNSEELMTKIIEENTKYDLIRIFNEIEGLKNFIKQSIKNSVEPFWTTRIALTKKDSAFREMLNHSVVFSERLWKQGHPELQENTIDNKIKLFLDSGERLPIWSQLSSVLPSDEAAKIMNQFYDKAIENNLSTDYLTDEFAAKAILEVIFSKPISTKYSLSQFKEHFYKEVLTNIIKTRTVTKYDDSFYESKLVDRFNKLADMAILPYRFKILIHDRIKVKIMLVDEENNEIVFGKISTGQKTLINIISQIVIAEMSSNSGTVCTILEEFDAFLNPENIADIVPLFNNLESTLILTTHSPTTLFLFDNNDKTEYYNVENNDVSKISKINGQRKLLKNAKNISIHTFDTKVVFVESMYDRRFYDHQFNLMDNPSDKILNFVEIKKKASEGGKSQIYHIYNAFKTNYSDQMAFLIDWDGEETQSESKFVNNNRYTMDSFLFDPHILETLYGKLYDGSLKAKFIEMFGDGEMVKVKYTNDGIEDEYEIQKTFMVAKPKEWAAHVLEYLDKDMNDVMQTFENNKILFNSWKDKLTQILETKGSEK